MQTNVKVLDVMPEQTGIEKITIICPECGQFQTIFGAWNNGDLRSHACEKCKFDMIIRINKQEKLI